MAEMEAERAARREADRRERAAEAARHAENKAKEEAACQRPLVYNHSLSPAQKLSELCVPSRLCDHTCLFACIRVRVRRRVRACVCACMRNGASGFGVSLLQNVTVMT